jgi:plasmid stabilization system protein ParE
MCALPLAEADPEAIGDYIARDSPRRALTFIRELRQRYQRIAEMPHAAFAAARTRRRRGW